MKDFLTLSFTSTNEIPTLNSVYMIDLKAIFIINTNSFFFSVAREYSNLLNVSQGIWRLSLETSLAPGETRTGGE